MTALLVAGGLGVLAVLAWWSQDTGAVTLPEQRMSNQWLHEQRGRRE